MEPRLRVDIGGGRLGRTMLGTGPAISEPARIINQFWPDRSVVSGLSVRTLFDGLFTALALPPGQTVLMSAVNVGGMAAIVRAHGLKPVAVDIDPLTLSPAPGALRAAAYQTGATVVVMAQLFGASGPVPDVQDLRNRGVLIVEDAAQAWSGGAWRGDPMADVSLFSFGPIKRRTALGGGVGVFRDENLGGRVAALVGDYPRKSPLWFRRRALKYLFLKMLSQPAVYGGLLRGLSLVGRDPDHVIGGVARGFGGRDLLSAIRFQLPDEMYRLLVERLGEGDDATARRAAVLDLEAALPSEMTGIGSAAPIHAAWLAPIRVRDPASLIRHLRRRGFDATQGATSLTVLDRKAAPKAADLLDHIAYLPHPVHLSEKNRRRLVAAILEWHRELPSSLFCDGAPI